MSDPTPVCDFCGGELGEVVWTFPCETHEIDPMPEGAPKLPHRLESEGDWSACPACKRLIVSGNRDKLAKRGVRNVPNAEAMPKQALAIVRKIQDTFWRNRAGQPHRESPQERAEPVGAPRVEHREPKL